ncbi:flagellar hook-basal body protein [Candidatus Margulisiibacteriota bacterium]
MLSHVHMAKSLQFQLQRKMQILTSNIANITSPGFKRKVVRLESTMPSGPLEETIAYLDNHKDYLDLFKKKQRMPEYGSPVRIIEIRRDYTPGTLEVTNRDTDLAITNGPGFFQFRTPDGAIKYSRGGNLAVDYDGNLVDQNGNPLEPAIRLPRGYTNLVITEEGRVFAQIYNDTKQREIGQITLATFKRPEELADVGQNLMKATPYAGEPVVKIPGEEEAGKIAQGSLELGNVNILDQMMEIVLVTRMFHMIAGAQSGVHKMMKVGADLKL